MGNTRNRHVNPWWVAVVSGMASYIDSCAIISSGTALVIYQQTFGLDNGPLIINFIRTPPTFIRTCADECGNPIP